MVSCLQSNKSQQVKVSELRAMESCLKYFMFKTLSNRSESQKVIVMLNMFWPRIFETRDCLWLLFTGL